MKEKLIENWGTKRRINFVKKVKTNTRLTEEETTYIVIPKADLVLAMYYGRHGENEETEYTIKEFITHLEDN